MKEGERFKAVKYVGDKQENVSLNVPTERPITIMLNEMELVTFLATPAELEALAIGYLFTEGFINGRIDLKQLNVDSDGYIWVTTSNVISPDSREPRRKVLTSGCGRGISFSLNFKPDDIKKVRTDLKVPTGVILDLMKETLLQAEVHKVTGGVHVTSVCDVSGVLSIHEDIGRHNTVDKAIGWCLLNNISFNDKIFCTSGRIASEMMIKTAIAGVPIVVSHTSPTDVGVEMGEKYGVTIIGYVRAGKMTIYSHPSRIAS